MGSFRRVVVLQRSTQPPFVGAGALLIGAGLLGACGGRVESEPPPGTDGTGTSSSDGDGVRGDADGPTGGSDDPADSPSDKTPLGRCSEGFLRSEHPGRACNWLAEDRCYEEKLDACACICPQDRDSTCLSGFYGGDGSATRVSCD